MITLQHSALTLLIIQDENQKFGKFVNLSKIMEIFHKLIPVVLLPDSIRCKKGISREISHFESAPEGTDGSWMKYPDNIKDIDVSKIEMYLVPNLPKAVLGWETNLSEFIRQNYGLDYRVHKGVKMHLKQDKYFDAFIREVIDCTRNIENTFIFDGIEMDGTMLRKLIFDMEMYGFFVLAEMAYEKLGITLNQKWFDENVKHILHQEYDPEMAEATYRYMQIPDYIDALITDKCWAIDTDLPEWLKYETKKHLYEQVFNFGRCDF